MPVPCLRPAEPTFEHETEIVLEDRHGVPSHSYDCRIEFSVAADDSVHVRQVDVWSGSREHGRWRDCRLVLNGDGADGSLHEKANDMAELLFDTVSVEVEDFRAEQKRADYEQRIDNADARGHARQERIAERNER